MGTPSDFLQTAERGEGLLVLLGWTDLSSAGV